MLELLYQAAYSDYGIIVRTNDVERLRQKLYSLRRGNPELQDIALVVSPVNPTEELWLLKKGNEDERGSPEAYLVPL